MFDIGTAGHAILFMAATVGQIIVLTYWVAYASHCFLVVLESTAAGHDEVAWPDEPLFDWVWKAFYLVWLVAFWLVPAWLLLGLIGPALTDGTGLPFGVLLVGVVWLVFPVSLFSSSSANSRWVVFHPETVRRFARHLPSVLVVYLATGALVAGSGWLFYVTLVQNFAVLPLAAAALAATVLIDARLWGRIAWLLAKRTPRRKRARPKREEPEEPEVKAVSAVDPWEVPPPGPAPEKAPAPTKAAPSLYPWEEEPEASAGPKKEPEPEEDEWDPDRLKKGYALKEEEPPPPPPRRPDPPRREDSADLPMGMLPPEEESPEARELKKKHLHDVTEVPEREAILAGHDPEPEPPARLLWSGVYQFPWYPRSIGPWGWLTFFGLLMGLLGKIQADNWPGG